MIDHVSTCQGTPCTCASAWDDTWGAANPSIGIPVACNCIHISGVWMTRHAEQCKAHPCVACLMRAGHHINHIHIEGWGALPDEVQVRNCWACGKQQYLNRQEEWTHVYPAAGCIHEHDTRDQNKQNEGTK